ncbi:hypothetical protein [Lelliottia nimipressuralis]|uniref:Uncharacterized protein n=1 Tax=Lelliottia nimipressuralis TaxID=69220 RepID=A0ABD4KDG8_9ENTR|nr:hypothetical protein [Lelliottia nimipressuralis]MBF4178902.1 hypothetical protein [Lelliottia nimipressuralis]
MGWMSAIGDFAMDMIGEGADSGTGVAAEGFMSPVADVGSSNWWEKGIEKMMPSIMGAAMRPKPQQHAMAAPGGHGVQANTSGVMKPFDEVREMADDNPLSGIHQWSNLFS